MNVRVELTLVQGAPGEPCPARVNLDKSYTSSFVPRKDDDYVLDGDWGTADIVAIFVDLDKQEALVRLRYYYCREKEEYDRLLALLKSKGWE